MHMTKHELLAIIGGVVAVVSAAFYILKPATKETNEETDMELDFDEIDRMIKENQRIADEAIREVEEILNGYSSDQQASEINRNKPDLHEIAREYVDYTKFSKSSVKEPDDIQPAIALDTEPEEELPEEVDFDMLNDFFEPENNGEEGIHLIDIDQYGENYGYRLLDLVYYKDGVIADVRDRRVSDIDKQKMLGDEILVYLKDLPDNGDTTAAVHVVNHDRCEYYEILIDASTAWTDIVDD